MEHEIYQSELLSQQHDSDRILSNTFFKKEK